MSNQRRDALATAGAGYGGVIGAAALRQKGLQRAHFEDTKTPVKRARIGAERQLLRGARGRRTWLAGAGLGAVSAPAAVVGTHRAIRPSKPAEEMAKRDREDGMLLTGLRGAQQALGERLENQRDAPPRLSGTNVAATVGSGLAGTGLGALALRGRRMNPLARSGALSAAGTLGAAGSVPVQAKHLERKTGGEYTVTPAGVKRRKKPPRRPSKDATMIDARTGTYLPAGVSKAEDDPGAGMSRARRRATVAATGGLPIIGDFTQAGAAGRLSAEPYRRRTAAEVFTANNVGNLAGAGAGALGAAALAQASPRARSKMDAANAKVEGVRSDARAKAGQHVPPRAKDAYGQARSTYDAGREKVRAKMPPSGRAGAAVRSRTGYNAARSLIRAHPGSAAIGGLAGTMVGGQIGMHGAYTHAMNRDDRYRNANRLARRGSGVKDPVGKREMSRKDSKELARRKQKQAALSVIAGGAGMTALGATGITAGARSVSRARAAAAARRAGTHVPKEKKPKTKLEMIDQVKTPLLAISGGVGGYGSMNFAGMQRKEAQNLDPSIKKALRLAGVRRPSGITRGHLRRRRMPSGLVRTTTVRGSLR